MDYEFLKGNRKKGMYARLLNTLKVVNLKTHLKVVWVLTFSELILEMIVESNTFKT